MKFENVNNIIKAKQRSGMMTKGFFGRFVPIIFNKNGKNNK